MEVKEQTRNRIVTCDRFIKSAIGVIYELAPNHKPRKIDEIISHIENYFYVHDITDENHWLQLWADEADLINFVDEVIGDCNAFRELNLSQVEFENGVSIDDPREGYVFVTFGCEPAPEHDFIDLDACKRNIADDLSWHFLDEDLFDRQKVIVSREAVDHLYERLHEQGFTGVFDLMNGEIQFHDHKPWTNPLDDRVDPLFMGGPLTSAGPLASAVRQPIIIDSSMSDRIDEIINGMKHFSTEESTDEEE